MNLFHGRIDEETPIHEGATGEPVYVRPHLLEIHRQPKGAGDFRATIKHINSAGPLVKIEALSEWGAPVQVELSQEKFRELQLTKEETVFIIPKELKVFQKKATIVHGHRTRADRCPYAAQAAATASTMVFR